MPREQRISVLLADDHALVRTGFRRMLEDDPAIVVVGEASNGEDAVRLAAAHRPDVILMDCAMPQTSGLVAAQRIVKEHPGIAVVMLSMHAEDTLVRQALAAGARGYILKSALDLDLASVVKQAAAGQTVIDPGLARTDTERADRPSGLTPRELEVLQLICEGLSNRDIAGRLNLSVNTVSVHRANIMNELGVHKTAELVALAIRKGLVTLP
jgi:DNA-binding NarL/FixJ family response regulator